MKAIKEPRFFNLFEDIFVSLALRLLIKKSDLYFDGVRLALEEMIYPEKDKFCHKVLDGYETKKIMMEVKTYV